MATKIWVNFVLGNGLLPDGTKPLPEPKIFCVIHLPAISQGVLMNLFRDMSSEIAFIKLQPYLTGARELNVF